MTLVGWSQIVLVLALVVACAVPLSAFIARVFAGERTFLTPGAAAGRARLLSPRRRRRGARAGLATLRDGDDRVLHRRLPVALRAAAAAERAAAQSAAASTRSPRTSRSTPRSASSPTPTGRTTAARRTMSHLDPDARPHRAQFPFRRDRPRDGVRAGARLRALVGDDGRQFLGRYDPRHALHPAADLRSSSRSSSSRWACRRRSPAPSTRRRSKAPSRPSRSGRWRARRSIKELGTNGGGFFNANSAHPFENPNALDQHRARSGRCC